MDLPKRISVAFPEGSGFDNQRVYNARLVDATRQLYALDIELTDMSIDMPVGEGLAVTLPRAKRTEQPTWEKYSLVPLHDRCTEYRGCNRTYDHPAEFFGGYKHEVELRIDMGGKRKPLVVKTWPTSAPNGTTNGSAQGNYLRANLLGFFREQKLRPRDKICFRRTGLDKYDVWVERKKGRPPAL